jgi:hypothetical protein
VCPAPAHSGSDVVPRRLPSHLTENQAVGADRQDESAGLGSPEKKGAALQWCSSNFMECMPPFSHLRIDQHSTMARVCECPRVPVANASTFVFVFTPYGCESREAPRWTMGEPSACPTGLRDVLADRYRLDRELGRGGRRLPRARPPHDRPVALKVLLPYRDREHRPPPDWCGRTSWGRRIARQSAERRGSGTTRGQSAWWRGNGLADVWVAEVERS